jgi:hypothetical protein
VLKGEMSLIGPRPERPEIAEKIERALPEFRHRLLVRPGITGLAQMRLPADSDLHTVSSKLAHDLNYVRGMGPSLDVRIAISTGLHFVGWAANAASRRLVDPFAPSPGSSAFKPTPQMAPGLTPASHGVGSLQLAARHDDLSRAA